MKNLSTSTYFRSVHSNLYPCSYGLHRSHASGQDRRGCGANDLHCWRSCGPRWNSDPLDDGDHD